jgi:hypothetical protein
VKGRRREINPTGCQGSTACEDHCEIGIVYLMFRHVMTINDRHNLIKLVNMK